MKNTLVLFLACSLVFHVFLATPTFAQTKKAASTTSKKTDKADKGIQFLKGSWKDALKKAEEVGKPIFVDAYTSWCGPCKRMNPILKELEKKYEGRVDFYKMDVDKNQLDDGIGVSSIPTYLFIKNSNNLEQTEGAMTKQKMIQIIENHLSGESSATSNTEEEEYYEE